MEKEKLISIITPSYNQGEFIKETIQSVLMQEGNFYIDYIIMDGGSKDQSVDVIKKYEKLLKENCFQEKIDNQMFYISRNEKFQWNKCKGISYRWVSEKDGGQADAINKGIKKSFGSIIGWLNSDDVYYPDVLELMISQDFKNGDFFYGKGMWISKIGKRLLPYPVFEPSFYSFFYQCTLCQPAVFFTKKAVSKIGLLNNNYYCGFDFEYWMRAISYNMKFIFVDSYLAKSRMYLENKSLANQDTVRDDITVFKKKYYENLKLNKNKLKKYEYIYNETFDQVQKLKHKLKNGEKINLLLDATVILNDAKKDMARSGIFFTAFNILKEMLNRGNLNVSLFCHSSQCENLKNILNDKFGLSNIKILTEKKLTSKDKKHILEVENIDVYLSPVFKIPSEIKAKNNIIKYTILYDTIMLMFPEYFPVKQAWLMEMIEEINGNDYYFAISENTKNDFIKCVSKINPEHVRVAYLAAAENFYKNLDKTKKKDIFKKYNIPENKKYIFSLCTLEPRKNLIMSIKCFVKFIEKNKIDNLIFVLGGSHWEQFVGELEKEINNFKKFKDKIKKAGYIDDEDLSVLYSNSEFFIYPSLYEGFGLPVLEAMKCGVPVITSNNSSLPEVIGDAGIIINPKSEGELLDAFSQLYFNDQLKANLSKKGLERAKLFSWEKTVDVMLDDIFDKIKNSTHGMDKNKNNKKLIYLEIMKSRCLYFLKIANYEIVFFLNSPRKGVRRYFSYFLSNSRLGQLISGIFKNKN